MEKLEIIIITQVNIEKQCIVCCLIFNVSNEIPVVFHRGSNYDYHFIIKELANEFEGQFECIQRKVQNFFSSNKKGNYRN